MNLRVLSQESKKNLIGNETYSFKLTCLVNYFHGCIWKRWVLCVYASMNYMWSRGKSVHSTGLLQQTSFRAVRNSTPNCPVHKSAWGPQRHFHFFFKYGITYFHVPAHEEALIFVVNPFCLLIYVIVYHNCCLYLFPAFKRLPVIIKVDMYNIFETYINRTRNRRYTKIKDTHSVGYVRKLSCAPAWNFKLKFSTV